MAGLKLVLVLIAVVLLVKACFRRAKEDEIESRKDPGYRLTKTAPAAFALFIVFLLLLPAIGFIPAGYRGVVLRFGAVTGRVLHEGVYIVTPIAENVELMSVQVRAYEALSEAASKDLQDVKAKVTLNYSLDPLRVDVIYQTLRHEYEQRILSPAIQEAVKASTAQFDAEKLIVERPLVKAAIEKNLHERLSLHNIVIDAISITDFKFSDEFAKAIELKVTALQDALREKNKLEQIKFEAQQRIERAKAEAEALRIQREQISALLVQKQAIEKWDGKLPNILMSGRDGAIPFIDVAKLAGK